MVFPMKSIDLLSQLQPSCVTTSSSDLHGVVVNVVVGVGGNFHRAFAAISTASFCYLFLHIFLLHFDCAVFPATAMRSCFHTNW
jgi:hypothetical protein